ncbi:unannotated protein [freshwater metagenome]|uniref:Unannotated protein n=1 Tax=freshwater metagenome TaxID=449393 RepID=A0A6J7ELZ5_9ZZZZ
MSHASASASLARWGSIYYVRLMHSDQAAAAAADLALLRRFEPVLHLNSDELFLPAAVDRYVSACSLRQHTEQGVSILVPAGALTVENLAVAEGGRSGVFLQFVAEHERRKRHPTQRRSENHGLARLARVGLLGRIFDVLFRVSLLLRQTVPNGVTGAAAWKARRIGLHNEPVYYGRVVRDGGWTVLHYTYFYAMNDWRSTFSGVNDHEADWEQVMVYVEEVGDTVEPHWVAYSRHDHVGDDLRRAWDDPEVILFGEHPTVFVGGGSHAGYFQPGEYVTRVEAKAIDGVKRFSAAYRRLLHISPPPGGFGIPYVDHAGGNGVILGPGGQYEWAPRVLGPLDPWVADFRGLWGLDTADRTGGERAPTGPRFERDGSIRQSWVDPVGYAGLQKVAPPSRVDEIRQERLAALDLELAALEIGFDEARTRLRAEVLVGSSGADMVAAAEVELVRLRRREAELRAERRRLETGRTAPVDRRAHIRHPAVPDPHDGSRRGRALNLWVLVSVPIVFAFAALAVRFLTHVLLWTAVVVGGFMLVEAFLRKRVVHFLWASFATGALLGAIAVTVYFAVHDWRWALLGVFSASGILVLLGNLRERYRRS